MISSIYDVNRQQQKPVNAQPQGLTSLEQPITATELPVYPQADTQASGNSFLSGLSGNYGNIAMGIGSAMSMLPKKNEFNNSQYQDPVQVKQDARENAVGQTKDTVASAFGPWGQLFRGIEKGGNAIGDSIGGDTGNYISAAFSPDEAIMAANSDPDISTGDKILGTILPFHAAKMSRKAKQARMEKAAHNKRIGEKIMYERQSIADARMQDGLQQIEDLRAIKSSQLNLLSPKY